MNKLKSFVSWTVGMITAVVVVVVLVAAYSSKIPGFGMLQKLAGKLPGSDVAPATA